MRRLLLLGVLAFAVTPAVQSADRFEPSALPVVAQDNFEDGDQKWEILDPAGWRIAEVDGGHVLSQHVKKSAYQPPHRSPFHVALLRAPIVTDFELTARVRSTHKNYNHRDVVLIFVYQDAAHHYYAHLSLQTDDNANQIMKVNDADRKKISIQTNEGIPWDDDWHTVRVVRDAKRGTIEVFWDDEKKPRMTAQDKTFAWGQVGIGTFDDTADWDDIVLRGVVPKPPADHVLPGGSKLVFPIPQR